MTTRHVALRGPLDLAATLGTLVHGLGDRTIRLRPREAWLAMRLARGTATLRLRLLAPTELEATAWGAGTDEALDGVPALVGELDEPERLVPHHPLLRELARRHAGLRMPRTRRVFAALVPSIIYFASVAIAILVYTQKSGLKPTAMRIDRDPVSSSYIHHVYEAREGARGATGSAGGGCGCN